VLILVLVVGNLLSKWIWSSTVSSRYASSTTHGNKVPSLTELLKQQKQEVAARISSNKKKNNKKKGPQPTTSTLNHPTKRKQQQPLSPKQPPLQEEEEEHQQRIQTHDDHVRRNHQPEDDNQKKNGIRRKNRKFSGDDKEELPPPKKRITKDHGVKKKIQKVQAEEEPEETEEKEKEEEGEEKGDDAEEEEDDDENADNIVVVNKKTLRVDDDKIEKVSKEDNEENEEEEEEEEEEENYEVERENEQKEDKEEEEEERQQPKSKGKPVSAQLGGYVLDLVRERERADFREIPLPQPDVHFVARKLGKSNALQSCEYIDKKASSVSRILHNANCRDTDMVLSVFNGFKDTARYVCGEKIPPGGAVVLQHHDHTDEECQVVRFSEHDDVPINGKGMPAITITKSQSDGSTTQSRKKKMKSVECDIPCQMEADLPKISRSGSSQWDVDGFQFTVTMADPYYYDYAKIERTSHRRNKYFSTVSLQSSVPLSFFDSEKYDLRNANAIDWKKASNKATYLVSANCQGARRNKWVAAVRAVMDVEAYGSCEHNTDLEKDETLETLEGRLELMRKNRIVLAFEAGTEKDYITEVVWEALLSGAVPAIFGAMNLKDRLPPNSAIFASNYNSWDAFAKYVKQVSEDKTLWQSYHAWRADESILDRFETMMSFTQTPPECRMCRWAYAKKHGLGWNHTLQKVQENAIPRTLCTGKVTLSNEETIATAPFREVWVEPGTKRIKGKFKKQSCTGGSVQGEVETDSYTVQRKIVEHDGVVDVTIQRIEFSSQSRKDVILRLEIDGIHNTEGAYFRDTHTLVKEASKTAAVSSASIQDDRSKITVLANWETDIRSPQEGVIEIIVLNAKSAIDQDEQRRIRVVTEDMNVLHDKLTEYFPSPYGRLMMHDFIDPLEFYYEA
jgi:hypothetical protein